MYLWPPIPCPWSASKFNRDVVNLLYIYIYIWNGSHSSTKAEPFCTRKSVKTFYLEKTYVGNIESPSTQCTYMNIICTFYQNWVSHLNPDRSREQKNWSHWEAWMISLVWSTLCVVHFTEMTIVEIVTCFVVKQVYLYLTKIHGEFVHVFGDSTFAKLFCRLWSSPGAPKWRVGIWSHVRIYKFPEPCCYQMRICSRCRCKFDTIPILVRAQLSYNH